MDPNEQAMSYDLQMTKQITRNDLLHSLNTHILHKCLRLDQSVLTPQEYSCIQQEYLFLKPYIDRAKDGR